MALGALDRGHVTRWLRHFRSWRSDAYCHRSFSHPTRRGWSHWSEPGVWCCHWSRRWRANVRSSWPKEINARRYDYYHRRLLYQCAGQWTGDAVHRTTACRDGSGYRFPGQQQLCLRNSAKAQSCANDGCHDCLSICRHAARGNGHAAVAIERKRSGLATIFSNRMRSCLALFCLTPLGARKSALVGISRQICGGGASLHSDHSRTTTDRVAAYR